MFVPMTVQLRAFVPACMHRTQHVMHGKQDEKMRSGVGTEGGIRHSSDPFALLTQGLSNRCPTPPVLCTTCPSIS